MVKVISYPGSPMGIIGIKISLRSTYRAGPHSQTTNNRSRNLPISSRICAAASNSRSRAS